MGLGFNTPLLYFTYTLALFAKAVQVSKDELLNSRQIRTTARPVRNKTKQKTRSNKNSPIHDPTPPRGPPVWCLADPPEG